MDQGHKEKDKDRRQQRKRSLQYFQQKQLLEKETRKRWAIGKGYKEEEEQQQCAVVDHGRDSSHTSHTHVHDFAEEEALLLELERGGGGGGGTRLESFESYVLVSVS